MKEMHRSIWKDENFHESKGVPGHLVRIQTHQNRNKNDKYIMKLKTDIISRLK